MTTDTNAVEFDDTEVTTDVNEDSGVVMYSEPEVIPDNEKKGAVSHGLDEIEIADWSMGEGVERTGYIEIYNQGFEYLILDRGRRAVTQWMYCKDYVQDMFWSMIHGKPAQIHGFNWNKDTHRMPCMNTMRCVVREQGLDNFLGRGQAAQEFMNRTEEALGFKTRTKVLAVTNPDTDKNLPCLYFVSPKEWRQYPTLVCLWTMAIRIGIQIGNKLQGITDIKDAWAAASVDEDARDSRWLKDAIGLVHEMFDRGPSKVLWGKTYEHLATVGDCHHRSGINAIATGKHAFTPVTKGKNGPMDDADAEAPETANLSNAVEGLDDDTLEG